MRDDRGARAISRLRTLRLGAIVAPLVLAVIFGAASWTRALDKARETARDNAGLVREYVLRLIQTQDLLLTAADEAFARFRGGAASDVNLHAFLAALEGRVDMGFGLSLLDADGRIVASSEIFPPEGRVTDRDYIAAAEAGTPFFVDRIALEQTGADALVVSRRRPGTPYSGVWVSAVDVRVVRAFLRGVTVRPGDSASILRADGRLLVRNFPMTEAVVLSPETPVMRKVSEGPSGFYEARAVSDGVTRLYYVTQIGELPLYANYGVSMRDLFLDWLQPFVGVSALLAALSVAGGALARSAARGVAAEAARAALEFDRRLLAEAEKSAAAREMMLRELNHRVKNSLAMIQALIRLQRGRKDGPDLDEVGVRVLAIAKIHDLLYRSADAFSIDFAALLREVTQSDAIVPPERGLDVQVASDALTLDAEIATPLALCAVELITNAVKHAGGPAGGGRIEVRLTRGATEATLVVADDGPGLPKELGRNSGLRVVEALVAQVGGRLEIGRGPGARIEIVFPLPSGEGPEAEA
jgi:two-component sensor histidine kinase